MERRAALAIGLSLLILYLYQAFVLKPGTTPPPAQTASSPASPATSSSGAAPSPATGQQPPAAQAAGATPVVSEGEERQIVVDNGEIEAVVTNRGGRILSWRLKDYLDANRAPVDLVPRDIPSNLPRPLSLA
jgi:YidC/Oxa1 family membrane protein insertase